MKEIAVYDYLQLGLAAIFFTFMIIFMILTLERANQSLIDHDNKIRAEVCKDK